MRLGWSIYCPLLVTPTIIATCMDPWSIKNVMPTIDASLDYGLRGEVQEGMAAQAAFMELRSPDIQVKRSAELRAALLDYCQHDTWVMVVLRRFLCGEDLRLRK